MALRNVNDMLCASCGRRVPAGTPVVAVPLGLLRRRRFVGPCCAPPKPPLVADVLELHYPYRHKGGGQRCFTCVGIDIYPSGAAAHLPWPCAAYRLANSRG